VADRLSAAKKVRFAVVICLVRDAAATPLGGIG
jgi:hypothetical protein